MHATTWATIEGTEHLGLVQSSGMVGDSFLLRRADGQMVQVSDVLEAVLRHTDPATSAEELASLVTQDLKDRRVNADGVLHVLEHKLAPLGLVVASTSTAEAAPPPAAPRSNPLLGLRVRAVLLRPSVVRRIAAFCAPVFIPGVVLLALLAVLVLAGVLIATADLPAAMIDVLSNPADVLGLVAITLVGGFIHEFGHAAACHYGGARPGGIGVGIYLIIPAFFTNVTDSYRLDRRGRLRTDLGGLYFNVWCLLLLGGGYLLTESSLLLVGCLVMVVEMVQQLLPTVRFDGYFVLSDLAGVPDLFSRVRPVLRSLIPGSPVDRRVSDLRPRARRTVTVWVLTVVPLLVFGLGWMLINLPVFIRTAVTAIATQAGDLSTAFGDGQVIQVILGAVSVVLLAIPLIGLAVLLPRLAWAGAMNVRSWFR